MADSKNVYQLIAEVSAELSKEGISKDRTNQIQGYAFRGIDDVYNSLSSIMSKLGLVILPKYGNRQVVERISIKGGALFYVTIDGEFTLVSAHDGSTAIVFTTGEAMDSGDKGTNKAMSAAYKYMAMQVFCIPTQGDNDADSTTHEVIAKKDPIFDEPVQRALPPIGQAAQHFEGKQKAHGKPCNDCSNGVYTTSKAGKVYCDQKCWLNKQEAPF